MSALLNPEWKYDVCCSCAVEFGSPVLAFRRKDNATFYCPNGHAQSYTHSETDALRKQLAAEHQRVVAANAARWAAEAEKTKAERKLKRVEKRIQGGVCPCCNRHFVNVERHMASKHPPEKQ